MPNVMPKLSASSDAMAGRAGRESREAVVRGARYGRWNGQSPGLFFESWLADGSATLHVLYGAEARDVMTEAGVSGAEMESLVGQSGVGGADVAQLEGHPCLIAVDGYHVRFVSLTGGPRATRD